MTAVPNSFDNPEFRKELSEMFDDKLSPIVEVQKEQAKIIARHNRDISRGKGIMTGIALVLSFLEAKFKGWV